MIINMNFIDLKATIMHLLNYLMYFKNENWKRMKTINWCHS